MQTKDSERLKAAMQSRSRNRSSFDFVVPNQDHTSHDMAMVTIVVKIAIDDSEVADDAGPNRSSLDTFQLSGLRMIAFNSLLAYPSTFSLKTAFEKPGATLMTPISPKLSGLADSPTG